VSEEVIYSHSGLVDIHWRRNLQAVHLIWHSEYNEGTGVREAVQAAINFVKANGVTNWLVDISRSDEALSDRDYEWVSSDGFRDMIRNSPLQRFVMIPPGPQSKQDTSWIADWEKNTLSNFGNEVSAKVSSDMAEIQEFFCAELTGENQ